MLLPEIVRGRMKYHDTVYDDFGCVLNYGVIRGEEVTKIYHVCAEVLVRN